MEDRFKFRAWDIEDKEYTEVIGLGTDRSCLLSDNWVKNETQIFEQCTGLRDKNGVLVYEGDVVKVNFSENFLNIKGTSVGFVKYVQEDCGFYVQAKNGRYTFGFLKNGTNPIFEVIGNIHEIADLLDDKSGDEND